MSTWREGALREQPRREAQDPTAPLPAATARQRGKDDERLTQQSVKDG